MTDDRGAMLAALWPDKSGPREYVFRMGEPGYLKPWPMFDLADLDAKPIKRHPCPQVGPRDHFTSERPLTKRQRRRQRGRMGK